MKVMKLSFYFGLVLSCINPLIAYDVKTLVSLGKNPQEVSQNIKLLAAQKVQLADVINQHFAKQENEIVEKIKAKYTISETEWKDLQEYSEELIAKDPLYTPYTHTLMHQPDEHSLVKKARELIAEYGMNPLAITIEKSNKGTACVSSKIKDHTLVHTMELNIPKLEKLPEQEFKAIVRHELTHLWYCDSLKTSCITAFLDKKISPENEPLLSDYFKNGELRADIMGTIHNTNTIQGLSSYFQKSIPYDQYAGHEHPTYTERVNALKQLFTYVNESKNHTAIAA